MFKLNDRYWRIGIALLALLAVTPAHAEELSREYRIKAAFLYNLTKFITWPNEKTWPADAPITICIYGFNPFDTYLEKLSERTAKNRRIAVRYLLTEADGSLDSCQVVFVSQYNTAQPDLLKAPIPSQPVLTVGDDPDFIPHNGLIGLVAVGNNVQLDIDLTRARQAGFTVSANLLEIAHKID
ncbi:MAG: YfiR family protein [Spongiibacteraceae bacterium]